MSIKNGNGNIELTPKMLVAVVTAALTLGSAGAWGFGMITPAAPQDELKTELLQLTRTVDNLVTVVEYNRESQEETAREVDAIGETLVDVRIALAELKTKLEN